MDYLRRLWNEMKLSVLLAVWYFAAVMAVLGLVLISDWIWRHWH